METLVASCGSLSECARSSFGPRGFDKLLLTSDGQRLTSASCSQFLSCLTPGHAVATVLSRSIQESAKFTGDGAASLALMIGAAVESVCAEADKKPASRHGIVHALRALQEWFMAAIVSPSVHGKSLVVPVEREEDAARVMRALLLTVFSGREEFGRQLVDAVTEMVMLELSASPVPHIPAALSDLRASSCMLLVPGSPLAGAELLDGLVLHHRLRSPDMPRSLSPARLLVLSSRLEDGDGAMPAVMQIGSSDSYRAAMAANRQNTAQRISALRSRDVNLVVCTEAISDMAAALCAEAGIAAIQLVSHGDANRVAKFSGCICPLADSRVESIHVATVGQALSCDPWSGIASEPGAAAGVVLRFSTRCPTLLIRAPSTPQCKAAMLAAKQGLDVVCRAVVGSGSRPGAVLDVAPGAGAVDVSIAEGVGASQAAALSGPSGPRGSHDADFLAVFRRDPACTAIAMRALQAMAMAVPEAILRSASDGRRAASKRMAIMQRLRAEHRKNWPACRTGCIFPEYTHALLSPLLEANQPSILSDQGHQPLGGELMLVDALGWGCCHPTVCMLHLWGSAVSTLIRLLSVDNVIPSRLRVGSPKAGGILGITESDSDSDSGDAAS